MRLLVLGCFPSDSSLLTELLACHSLPFALAINYRLAPETRFPGPLHDAVSAYFRLIDDLKIPPENIIIAGDSAGGGLSLALLMYLRDHSQSRHVYPSRKCRRS